MPLSALSANSPGVSVIIDTTPPSAALGGGTPTPGSSTFDFTVTYADANGVDTTTFDNNDVAVTGPNSFSQSASYISRVGNVATYRINAPGGIWNFGDNGSYTVAQNASQIADIATNLRAAGSIGTFNVAVPFAWVASNVLHVENGSATIALNGGNVDVTHGSTLSFATGSFNSIIIDGTSGADTIDITTAPTQPITFNGAGGANAINIHGGTATLANDVGAASASANVTIDTGATALFNASQHLSTLDVDGSATLAAGADKVIVATSLSVAGRLDLKDNDLVWDYSGPSPLGTFSAGQYNGAIGLVANAITGGTWSGNGIVTTMPAAVAPQHLTIIAVAEASALPGISPFDGVTLDGDAILFKYTYVGDTNLNGVIESDDFFNIDSAFPASGSVFGQTNGDFDLNGAIDADDYWLLDANYPYGQTQI
jgi:hypothetical protein